MLLNLLIQFYILFVIQFYTGILFVCQDIHGFKKSLVLFLPNSVEFSSIMIYGQLNPFKLKKLFDRPFKRVEFFMAYYLSFLKSHASEFSRPENHMMGVIKGPVFKNEPPLRYNPFIKL